AEVPRQKWASNVEFLLASTGMSIGLGNIWRFPYVAYSNGGGAFLLPYLIIMTVVGRSMFYMEMLMGQFRSAGATQVFDCVPIARAFGLAFVVYPQALSLIEFPRLWSVTFFAMLFLLAIDSEFGFVEAALTPLKDEIPACRAHETYLATICCICLCVLGLPIASQDFWKAISPREDWGPKGYEDRRRYRLFMVEKGYMKAEDAERLNEVERPQRELELKLKAIEDAKEAAANKPDKPEQEAAAGEGKQEPEAEAKAELKAEPKPEPPKPEAPKG
ncbi:hypothetical protein V5799_033692, partial [Amblyomma americanum]